MQEKSSSSAFPPWLSVLIGLALFGGVLLVDKPLQVRRSVEKELGDTFRQTEDVVVAKLWEDPFEATSRHLTAHDNELQARSKAFRAHYCKILDLTQKAFADWGQDYVPEKRRQAAIELCEADKAEDEKKSLQQPAFPPRSPVSAPASTIEQELRSYFVALEALEETQGLEPFRRRLRSALKMPADQNKVLFVGVVVPGGILDGNSEARRRYRIATVSALNRRGYFAEGEGNLSYLLFPQDRYKTRLITHLSSSLTLKSELAPVPYETFALQGGVPSDLPSPYRQVVVLWLDHGRSQARIHQDFARIVEGMVNLPRVDDQLPVGERRNQEIGQRFDVALIGPASSSALVEMLRAGEVPLGAGQPLASALQTVADFYLDSNGTKWFKGAVAGAIELDKLFLDEPTLPGEIGSPLGQSCAKLLKDADFRSRIADKARHGLNSKAQDSDPDFENSILQEWMEELLWSCAEIRFRERVGARNLDHDARISLPANRYRGIFDRIKVLSAYATVPGPIARTFAGVELERLKDDSAHSPAARANFSRTVVNDAKVLSALIEELERRGIDLRGDSAVNVALVTELDSSYGRAMPIAFQAAALSRSDERQAAFGESELVDRLLELGALKTDPHGLGLERLEQMRGILRRIHVLRYFRGLDGITTAKEARVAEASSSDQGKKLGGLLERAEGSSLLDQIRSVGIRLKELDHELRKAGDRIHAVGVLGSDFYDKQLVLQVLRTVFPDVAFFTTDLDGRYLHRDDQAWNRNLLVGSSFGFELTEDLQGEAPPFRDVYSTSTFLAGLLALGKCPISSGEGCSILGQALDQLAAGTRTGLRAESELAVDPLIFEIGISRAHQLDAAQPQGGLAIQPAVEKGWRIPWWQQKVFFLLILICIIALVVSRRALGYWIFIAAAALYLVASIVLVDLLFAEEPASLLDGVSVQGTEILRLLLIGLGVGLFVVLRHKIREVHEEIRPRFEPGSGLEVPELKWREYLHISETFKNWKWPVPSPDSGGSPPPPEKPAIEQAGAAEPQYAEPTVDATATWAIYEALQWSGGGAYWPDRQLKRVLAATSAAFLVVALGAWFFPRFFEFPLVPVRDALWADKFLRYTSLFVLTFACFWTLDTVRLCVHFVHRLARGRTIWPGNEENDDSARRRGLEPYEIGDYLDIRVIAPLSEIVSYTVLYPFLLLSIFILSRAPFFDCWTWPLIVSFVIAVLLVSIVVSAMLLQRAARRARESTLKYLHLASMRSSDPSGRHAKQLGLLIKEVEEIDSGAFGPWTSNPVVGALLLPFGGASAATLIEFLLQVGI